MNQNNILLAVLLVLLLPFAILMGQWSATDHVMVLGGTMIVIPLLTAIKIASSKWLLLRFLQSATMPIPLADEGNKKGDFPATEKAPAVA